MLTLHRGALATPEAPTEYAPSLDCHSLGRCILFCCWRMLSLFLGLNRSFYVKSRLLAVSALWSRLVFFFLTLLRVVRFLLVSLRFLPFLALLTVRLKRTLVFIFGQRSVYLLVQVAIV